MRCKNRFRVSYQESEECDCPACRAERGEDIYYNDMAEDFLVETRRVLLIGEINEISSTHICNQLQVFAKTKDPVYMYINSPGGDMSAGYSIIDQMALSRCPIYTIARGAAHSMAAMILAYGKRGHRYATPNSSMMLHSLIVQTPPDPIDSHLRMTDYLKQDCQKKITDLAKRLKLTAKQLTILMNETKWMSPKQAVKIGLIDGIWTSRLEGAIK